MQFMDDLRKSSGNKLLPFRSPAAMQQAGSIHPEFDFHQDPVARDITRLRRPTAVEQHSRPQLEQQDGLVHDARNLITSLQLLSDLLGEPGVLVEEHRHYAGDLKSLMAPLAGLVEQMAVTPRAKGDAGPGAAPVFNREPARPAVRAASRPGAAAALPQGWFDEQKDAGAMVKSCERMLAAIAGSRVSVQVSYERGLGELALSGESLTRVLINLVRNASEAMPNGGRVSITVRKGLGARPTALVTVTDTGLGIPAHAMGQVFQAGFSSKKLESKWPAAKHYGLGLTIVRDLVESAGGSVRVCSTLKKGTTFEMKLPCYRN